ncbi:MAG: hypothetical protein ACXU86_17445, partial [Archangium sp.]
VAAGRDWVPARLVSRGGVVAAEDGARHDRLEVGAAKTVALLPGAVVAVRLARDDREGILLPESALVPGIGGEVVYVEVSPGVFVPRPVQVAARFGGRVRLASGLSGSEQVVVRGAMALRGEAFRVESPEED